MKAEEQASAWTGFGDKRPTSFLQIYQGRMLHGDRGRKIGSAVMVTGATQAVDTQVTALFPLGGEDFETITMVQGLAYGRCTIQ